VCEELIFSSTIDNRKEEQKKKSEKRKKDTKKIGEKMTIQGVQMDKKK
jgi:hypothetical protein